MSLGRWFRNRPHSLEVIYDFSEWVFKILDPMIRRIGYRRSEKLLIPVEHLAKSFLFDCQMCGQCILHSTGMTCPMTCPKNLRNGPCGGVRTNGHCEVKPEMKCIWVEAYERSLKMPVYGKDIHDIQPPLNQSLRDSSAWINELKETKPLPQATLVFFITDIPVIERSENG